MEEIEIWKPIKGFEGLYEISNFGRVKSLGRDIVRKDGTRKVFRSRILKPYITSTRTKHLKVDLRTIDSIRYVKFVHRLVAESFIPNKYNKPDIDHIDTDPFNNRAPNLRWCTPKENSHNPLTKINHKIACDNSRKEISSQTRGKLSSYLRLHSNSGMFPRKAVIQLDLNGNYIKEYPSGSEAARQLGIKKDKINRFCRGERMNKFPGGFKWKFKNN